MVSYTMNLNMKYNLNNCVNAGDDVLRVVVNGTYIEEGSRYRMGALYVGYGNYRIGYK